MTVQIAYLKNDGTITNVIVLDTADSDLINSLMEFEPEGTTGWEEVPTTHHFFVDPTWTYSSEVGFRKPVNPALVTPVWFEEDLDWREPYPTDGKDYGWDAITNSWVESKPIPEQNP
jgi:hypothetical protein